MPWTWNAWETAGLSSTLTLASTTWPSVSATTFSMMGPSVRHGPHHGAQRSTTTGTSLERSTTSCSKVASVTSMYGAVDSLIGTVWRADPPITTGVHAHHSARPA